MYVCMHVCMYVGFTVDDLVRLQLPIKLPPGTVLDIYRKFRSICDCLAESASVTHQVCHTYIHYTILYDHVLHTVHTYIGAVVVFVSRDGFLLRGQEKHRGR